MLTTSGSLAITVQKLSLFMRKTVSTFAQDSVAFLFSVIPTPRVGLKLKIPQIKRLMFFQLSQGGTPDFVPFQGFRELPARTSPPEKWHLHCFPSTGSLPQHTDECQ